MPFTRRFLLTSVAFSSMSVAIDHDKQSMAMFSQATTDVDREAEGVSAQGVWGWMKPIASALWQGLKAGAKWAKDNVRDICIRAFREIAETVAVQEVIKFINDYVVPQVSAWIASMSRCVMRWYKKNRCYLIRLYLVGQPFPYKQYSFCPCVPCR